MKMPRKKGSKKIKWVNMEEIQGTCSVRHMMNTPRCKDCVYYGVQCNRYTQTVKKKPFECDEVDNSIIYRETGKYYTKE